MEGLSSLKEAVYGELFESAKTQMALIDNEVCNRHTGFDTYEECMQWADTNLCSIIAYNKSGKEYYFVTHYGTLLRKHAWFDHYCDVLFINTVSKGEPKRIPWIPKGIALTKKAKLIAEKSDGILAPLYHRDYFTPTGFFDPVKSTFNVAKPFPYPAKETGRDTSHIYTFIEHIAGECNMYVLAWLRTKMLYPTKKTQIVPIFVSRTQGTGKSTFAEVICKGLFGDDNVIVSHQYDGTARFNADSADALIISMEEKDDDDKRNSAASLKSSATASRVRKENKGVDPIYQDSYTDYVVTTNRDVPIKFDDTDQRRFMVMEADPSFTREPQQGFERTEANKLADEVFTKLYGQDANNVNVGVPFVDDKELVQQFKHELFTRADIASTNLRGFPHTPAYDRCITQQRTSEATEVDSITRSLAPFIKASLEAKQVQLTIVDPEWPEQVLSLANYVNTTGVLQYVPAMMGIQAHIAICRPIVYYDMQTGKPFSHAVTERCLLSCQSWLNKMGLILLPNMQPLVGGFRGITNRYKTAPAARIGLLAEFGRPVFTKFKPAVTTPTLAMLSKHERVGNCLRVNGKWQPDFNGEFETVNELMPGVTTLADKTKNVQYMDTLLFEADETSKAIHMIEETRLNQKLGQPLDAEFLYQERLRLQSAEAERLFIQGTACRVVYSGGKSYHILVRIKDPPKTLDEYKWLHAHLCLTLSDKLTFDTSTADPARLTRAPIDFQRVFIYGNRQIVGKQRLIYENYNNIFDYNWQVPYKQWANRPLESYEKVNQRRLVPHKPEYMEAMQALLYGTFWTDSEWNGRRQTCFFPAYRLCRLLGYSHNQLWSTNGILDGLSNYYRRSEIQYWESRESSDIIKQIDTDIDQFEEEVKDGL